MRLSKIIKRKIFYISCCFGIAIIGYLVLLELNKLSPDSSLINIHGPTPTATGVPAFTSKPTSTPVSFHIIEVPFSSQAPTGVWDDIHEEMCEEVTIIMAHAWVNGFSLSSSYTEKEIQQLVAWENDNFGTYIDTSAEQTAHMGQVVYGLHTRIINKPTIEDIKTELDQNHIVIMGMAGRLLNNPNYTAPGPLYHMLLIKGYDRTGFITNDDGTRKGESYHYSYDTLMAAAHDWNGDASSLLSSPAVAIVVSKN